MAIAQTAAEAFKLYEQALAADELTQRDWHREIDGRQLACALGVLGSDVSSPDHCPARVMPRWLARMVPRFFDRQAFDAAKDWGRRFYAELSRIDGQVPFSVVHDWQANFVAPLAIDVADKLTRPTAAHEAKRDLHLRALNGDTAPKNEWVAVLRPAYADAYANAYAYAYVDATADAKAYADAYANAYADAYADATADAKAYANADAKAYADAYADADAYAYANADAHAYAKAYATAYAYAKAYAHATAYAYANANADAHAIKRLADGMVECLSRVPAHASEGDR